jgi:hypothetical protein
VSDYDIGSLVRYVSRIEPERRPVIYRRIGEVALFQSGIFPDSVSLEELSVLGSDSYQRALEGGGVAPDETEAIGAVQESFVPATKAFAFMSDHYLGARRTKVFSLGD